MSERESLWKFLPRDYPDRGFYSQNQVAEMLWSAVRRLEGRSEAVESNPAGGDSDV